jgi:hypothetical protein
VARSLPSGQSRDATAFAAMMSRSSVTAMPEIWTKYPS